MAKLLDFCLSLLYNYLAFLWIFVAIKLYNKAGGSAIPFGKSLPLFFFKAKLMTQPLFTFVKVLDKTPII